MLQGGAHLPRADGQPVFHDDQHGTAIVAAAAASNALRVAGNRWEDIRVVALGAGAAGIACLKMMLVMGMRAENITMLDSKGVVHTKRNDLSPQKAEFVRDTAQRTTLEAMEGADRLAGRAARHGAVALSQSGQQRPVLPVHLPRRAGRRRDRDQ